MQDANYVVMLDTNILISMLFFPSATTRRVIDILDADFRVVVPNYVLDELRDVANRKFQCDAYTAKRPVLPFEFTTVPAHDYNSEYLPSIRDPKDEPILRAAIAEGVDVLLTGDKDFLSLDILFPAILNMTDFIAAFG